VAKKRKQRMPPWERNLLITLVLLGAVIAVAWYLNPEWSVSGRGEYSTTFAESIAGSAYKFVGDMQTRLYYPAGSAKAKGVPEDRKVEFLTEEAARKRGFRRGHG